MKHVRLTLFVFALLLGRADASFSRYCLELVRGILPQFNLTFAPRILIDHQGRFSVELADPRMPGQRWLLNSIPLIFGRQLGVTQVVSAFQRAQRDPRSNVHIFNRLLDAFSIQVDYDSSTLSRIPTTGPLIIVINHPKFGFDAMAVGSVVATLRNDANIMVTATLSNLVELHPHAIFTNHSPAPGGAFRNMRALWTAFDHLQGGGTVIMAPAAGISFLTPPGASQAVDAPWRLGPTWLAEQTNATILPVFVHGSPSENYIRTRQANEQRGILMNLNEIDALQHTTIRLTIGTPIPFSELANTIPGAGRAADRERALHLQRLTYGLGGINLQMDRYLEYVEPFASRFE